MARSLGARSGRVVVVAALATVAWVGSSSTARASSPVAERPCAVASLTVAFGLTGLDTGHVDAYLVFTDRAATSCSIDGYPSVSYVGADRTTIGNPSSHDDEHHARVVLSHGQSAHALFRESVPAVWSPTACKPVASSGLRVHPPGAARSVVLHFPETVCSGTGVHESTVAPVGSGPGPVPERCAPSQLEVRHGTRNGAAGTTYVSIVFTNPVLYTCTVHGYPRARSATGSRHRVVGVAATHVPGVAPAVWVQPFGGTARAVLGIADTGALPAARCRPRKASGFLVDPPQSSRASFIALAHTVCSTHLASATVSTVSAEKRG